MILTFADPYPEEIDYSIIARSCDWASFPTNYMCTQLMLGVSNARAVIGFQGQIDYLVRNLPKPNTYDVESFMRQHTLLPIYKPFIPEKRYQVLKNALISDNDDLIVPLLGKVSSGIPNHSFLMLCPICAEEDYSKFGERYFHRVHQISGVHVCPTHEVFLHKTNLSRYDLRTFMTADSVFTPVSAKALDIENNEHQALLFISQNMQNLLTGIWRAHEFQHLRSRYQVALYYEELATFRGNIRITKLLRKFTEYYSNDFLLSLGCHINGRHKRNWVARIGQKGSIQHPLRHLLVLNLIDKSVDFFLRSNLIISPFPNIPYPCLNPLCSKYNIDVIVDVQVGISRKRAREPLGTFKCPYCEFTYCRTKRDGIHDDRCKGKTISYGKVWDDMLIQLWNSSLTRTDIAQTMHVQYDTMIRQAKRLNLIQQESFETLQGTVSVLWCRERWLRIVSQNPNTPTAVLIEQFSEVYFYLQRYDLFWLESNTPDKRKATNVSRVDWCSRDEYFCPKVAQIAGAIVKEIPLKRVTINSIGMGLGYKDGAIHKDLKRLHKTSVEIQFWIESIREFAIRRIWYISSCLDYVPSTSEFKKMAGLSKSVQNSEVLNAVEQALKELEHNIVSKTK